MAALLVLLGAGYGLLRLLRLLGRGLARWHRQMQHWRAEQHRLAWQAAGWEPGAYDLNRQMRHWFHYTNHLHAEEFTVLPGELLNIQDYGGTRP